MLTNRWTINCENEVKNVAIVGGTHGNELHGIYLVGEINSDLRAQELKVEYPSLNVFGVVANLAAVAAIGTGAGRRYCEEDLNRCFLLQELENPDLLSVERARAKELDLLLGPKSSPDPKTDLILDFHSTTSNTGILLCCHPQDTFALQLIAFLQSEYRTVSASLWSDCEVPLLPTIARSGITVEVGPISHSTSNSALYQETKRILLSALYYTELHNLWITENRTFGPDKRTLCLQSTQIRLFERFATMGFPRNSAGAIAALIHPSLQGAPELVGGTTLCVGNPVFQIISDGSDIFFNYNDSCGIVQKDDDPQCRIEYRTGRINEELLYPMFINEAAYNEKDIAFYLMHARYLTVSIVTIQRCPH